MFCFPFDALQPAPTQRNQRVPTLQRASEEWQYSQPGQYRRHDKQNSHSEVLCSLSSVILLMLKIIPAWIYQNLLRQRQFLFEFHSVKYDARLFL